MSRRDAAAAALHVVLALATAGAAAGQGALDRVEELARAGRTHEARQLLTDWWAGDREAADRVEFQRGVWLRGVLTVDPEEASLDFRRLVVEYPGGPYTARALTRIAGAAAVTGDTAEAVRARETLARHYGGTPQGERARAWLEARRQGETGVADAPAAPAPGEPPPGAPGDPVADEGPGTPPVGGGEGAARGAFTVQLGAFATMRRARELVARARAAGLEPRLVRIPGSDLLRVRVGRFVSAAEAEVLRRGVVESGFEALVSDTADREEPVGGG